MWIGIVYVVFFCCGLEIMLDCGFVVCVFSIFVWWFWLVWLDW